MKQSQSLAPLGVASEHVSALCDGELDDRALDAWLAESRSRDEPLAQWQCYQLIGEVLRGQAVSPAASASREFLAALNEKLDAEQPPQVLVGATSPVPSVRGSAANDSVFRWKLVSGLASVVAVAAVGWTVLANAPQEAAGPVLAQGSTAAATAKVAAAQPRAGAGVPAATRPVVVSTSQGKVLRDPALERLLAEHRQHGGMSAFQASTGFIRNATYDDDSR
jgi:sigma-E factor negative regulatory protein RseA